LETISQGDGFFYSIFYLNCHMNVALGPLQYFALSCVCFLTMKSRKHLDAYRRKRCFCPRTSVTGVCVVDMHEKDAQSRYLQKVPDASSWSNCLGHGEVKFFLRWATSTLPFPSNVGDKRCQEKDDICRICSWQGPITKGIKFFPY